MWKKKNSALTDNFQDPYDNVLLLLVASSDIKFKLAIFQLNSIFHTFLSTYCYLLKGAALLWVWCQPHSSDSPA